MGLWGALLLGSYLVLFQVLKFWSGSALLAAAVPAIPVVVAFFLGRATRMPGNYEVTVGEDGTPRVRVASIVPDGSDSAVGEIGNPGTPK